MASDKFQKSYFDVLGICCSSEVTLIEKILKPLEGVQKVSVIVPTRTVIVVHDNLLISQIQIVKALNKARLEANIRVFGEDKKGRNWPSPWTIASGILLAISFLKFLYHPLHWIALAATVVGLPPVLMRSYAALKSVSLDINILALIAVAGTIALRDYTEAGSIVFLFTIAHWLESRASHKATAEMSSLMRMAPQKAVLAENGQVVDAKDVKVNTILAVKAGDVIPIDGIVVEGKSEVDEKTLTGESFPVAKQVNSNVWAGTLNLNGYISVKTTASADNSAVARMALLVEEAQHSKSKTQRLIDSCAKYYTPAVVLISAGVAIVPAACRARNLRYWFHLALVLLVNACPCALILSTPVATFCALTKAATMGVLIKGGDYLESLAHIKIVAFDKTGTITKGQFTVTAFGSVSPDVSIDKLLYWVSSIESKSSHPMAAALVEYGESKGVQPKPEDVEEFQIFPGEGISGEIGGKNIFVGNKRIAVRAGCKTVPSLEESKAAGSTIGYVLDGPRAVGIFSLSDTIRTGVSQAIDKLKSLGIRTAVLTGDSVAAAIHVQEQLKHAIGAVHAELLPEDKMKIIKELKREGPTAMVGDGMNDAPALATADIGISMGISGSAVATETGHITLMSNDIRRIPQSIRLAKTTRRKIFQNVAFSIITKLAILIFAFTGHPIIWAAVVSDVGTCLLVISNSMLVLRGGKEKEAGCSRLSENQSNGPPGCCRGEGACGADDRPPADKPRQCCLNGCQSSLPNENKEIVESNSSCGTRSCRGSSKPDSNGCQSGLCTGEKEMVESDSCQARSCCGGSKDMMPSSNGCQSSLCTGEKVGKEVVEADSSSKSRCCRGNSNMPSLNGCCSGEKVEKEIVESDSCPARSCCGGSSLIPSSNGCQSSLCSGEKVEKEIVEADSCRARSCCGSSKDIMPSSLCCEEKVEKEIVEADSCQARSCCGSSKDIMPSSLCCGQKVEKEIAEADSCRSLSCCASPKDITPSSLCRGEKVEKEIAEADSCGSRSCCGSSKDIKPSSLCCEEKVEKEIVEADSCRARSCCESSKDMMMPSSNGCQSSVCSGENFGKEIIESDSCQSRSCCGASASKDIMPSSDGCQSNLCGGEKVIIESDSCRAGSCCGSSKDMLPSSNGCQSTLRSGEKVEKEIVESDSCRVPSCCGSSKDIIPSLSIGRQSSPCTGDKELVESDICCGSSKAMMRCSDGCQSSLCSGEKKSVRPDSGGARSCCGNSKDKMPQTPAVHSHSTCGEPGHVDGGDGSHASGEGHHHVISILGESDGPDHKLGHCRRVECQVEVRPSRSCCSRGDGAHVLKHACAAAVCMAHGSKMGHQCRITHVCARV